jgi:probable HAF family extracellular repeat protein
MPKKSLPGHFPRNSFLFSNFVLRNCFSRARCGLAVLRAAAVFIGTAACLTPFASAQAIQPTVLNLPDEVVSSLATDVNQAGQVIGTYRTGGSNSQLVNFMWQNGTTTPIDPAEYSYTPWAINNNGDVLMVNPFQTRIFRGGGLLPLPRFNTVLPNFAEGAGINDSLQVAGCVLKFTFAPEPGGYAPVGLGQIAVLWQGFGTPEQISLNVPVQRICGQDINDRGQTIVNTDTTAYLWQQGRLLRALPSLTGGITFAKAINNAGQIVGYSSDLQQVPHAVMWQNGAIQDLGLPPGAVESWASDIDSAGRILIAAVDSSQGTSCWLWKNGSLTQLAGCIAAGGPMRSGSTTQFQFIPDVKMPAIASVGSGAIAAATCMNENGLHACIWNLP